MVPDDDLRSGVPQPPHTAHPFAHATGLIEVIRDDKIDVDEEAKFLREFYEVNLAILAIKTKLEN